MISVRSGRSAENAQISGYGGVLPRYSVVNAITPNSTSHIRLVRLDMLLQTLRAKNDPLELGSDNAFVVDKRHVPISPPSIQS